MASLDEATTAVVFDGFYPDWILEIELSPGGKIIDHWPMHGDRDRAFESAEFTWTEGKYACDCNRRLRLWDRDNPGSSDDPEVTCGGSIELVSLIAVHPDTGERHDLLHPA